MVFSDIGALAEAILLEEYLGGLTSWHIQRGKLLVRRGYGLHATTARIFGVKGRLAYGILPALPGAVALGAWMVYGVLYGPAAAVTGLLPYSVLLLGVAATVLGQILIPYAIEERLESQQTETIGELERRKDFEIMRDQIVEIELKRPGGFSPGHVQIKLNSGETVKVRIFSSISGAGDHRLWRIVELAKAFCGKEPLIRSLELSVWTL